jgi:hypothetical protein
MAPLCSCLCTRFNRFLALFRPDFGAAAAKSGSQRFEPPQQLLVLKVQIRKAGADGELAQMPGGFLLHASDFRLQAIELSELSGTPRAQGFSSQAKTPLCYI